MNTKRKFGGILSSSANPGELSLMVASLTQFVIGLASTWAVVHGLDAQAVTTQVQQIIDIAVTVATAGYTAVMGMVSIWGAARKLWYALFTKGTTLPISANFTASPSNIGLANVPASPVNGV